MNTRHTRGARKKMAELTFKTQPSLARRLQKKFSSFDSFTKSAIAGLLVILLLTPVLVEGPHLLSQFAASTAGNWNAQIVQSFPNSQGAGMLQDPVKPNELYAFYYAGTLNDGQPNHIAKSTDYGQTWTQQIDQTTFSGDAWGVAIDPNPNRNPNTPPTMYAPAGYGQNGLWKSTDGGVHWTNLFTQNEYQTGLIPKSGGGTVQIPPDKNSAYMDFYQVAILPDNPPNHILVTYHYADTLLESVDGGQTWDVHRVPAGNSDYVYGIDANTWIAASQDSVGIYRTTTAGRDASGNVSTSAWTLTTEDGNPGTFAHNHGFFSPYIDPVNKNIYFAGIGGILCSTNSGASWHKIFASNSIGTIAGTGNYLYASIPYSSTMYQVPKNCNQSTLVDWQNPQLQMNAQSGWNGQVAPYGTVSAFNGTNWITVQINYQSTNGDIWRYVEPLQGPTPTPTPCPGVCPSATPTPTPTNTPTPTPTPQPQALWRVYTGTSNYTDTQNNVWSKDQGFSGGTQKSFTNTISGTTDPALYQNERYGNTFSYTFPVPNGNYNVTLKFAELYWTSVGQRVFNVGINGAQVLSNFDILKDAGAQFTADDKTFQTTVSNGGITINFTTVTDNAKIDAIQIFPAGGSPTISPTLTPVPPTTTLSPTTGVPTPTPVPGDANGDGKVDLADLSLLATEWNICQAGLSADFNHDGCVNLTDFSLLAGHWNG